MCVWSKANRETQQTLKKGGNFAISKRFKRKRRIGDIVVLDFSPDTARPGGHSGKEDPFCSIDDWEHSRGVEPSDQDLQIGLQD